MKLSTLPRASFLIVAIAFWTLCIISIVKLLRLPGARGPIQLVQGDSLAMFVFNLRVITMSGMMFGPIVAGLLALTDTADLDKNLRQKWRVAAVICYIAAWTVLFQTQFFPTV
ncbi:hypothetical protein OAS39_07205 [Pirellulales bacterium]|nr:hypothetical protein [Pirellulales bacterium]